MFEEIRKQLKTASILLALLTILTGIIYPLAVTALAQLFFPWQANGSLVKKQGQSIGSVLIGQSFSSPDYFWGRPSATRPFPYNGGASSGSNYGPTNPEFLDVVKKRVIDLKLANAQTDQLIPVDLVTASGSGLDPEISPSAAFYQASRVALARHMSEEDVRTLIMRQIQHRPLGILGEPRINVLLLNLALDNIRTHHARPAPKPGEFFATGTGRREQAKTR